MKKCILSAALALLTLTAHAKSLVLLLSDSTEVYYLLAGDVDPKMTWADGIVTINDDTYELSGFLKFYISDTDDPTAVRTVQSDSEQPLLNAGQMCVAGQVDIRVYTTDGRRVDAPSAWDGTTTTLDTRALPAGTYVITFGTGTLKYRKQ